MIDESRLFEEISALGGHGATDPFFKGYDYAIDLVLDTIGMQSRVGEWIPVDEELPTQLSDCLVTLESGLVIQAWYSYLSREFRMINNQKFYDTNKVIAWQPLPEPYKGD